MPHVFLSHAHADRTWVHRVRSALQKARRKSWLDVDDIRLGGDWRNAIDTALKEATAVIVVLSPHSVRSDYVTYEWSFALGAGVPVIPVVVSASKLHPRLEALQHVDFTSGTPAWGRLIDALRSPTHNRPKASSVRQKAPVIYAEFELEDGRPVEVEESYRLWIGTRHVPESIKRVTYNILDESYDEDDRVFRVNWGPKDFQDWITSYGDIFLTARGKTAGREWRTQSTLVEALRRRYGAHPPASVRRALRDIENN